MKAYIMEAAKAWSSMGTLSITRRSTPGSEKPQNPMLSPRDFRLIAHRLSYPSPIAHGLARRAPPTCWTGFSTSLLFISLFLS